MFKVNGGVGGDDDDRERGDIGDRGVEGNDDVREAYRCYYKYTYVESVN